MSESISLGSSPVGEMCSQLGSSNYEERSIIECEAFAAQLKRTFAAAHNRPSKCQIRVKSCPHDFGNYLEVFAIYDSSNEESYDDAIWLEAHLPELWDEIARATLNLGAN